MAEENRERWHAVTEKKQELLQVEVLMRQSELLMDSSSVLWRRQLHCIVQGGSSSLMLYMDIKACEVSFKS